MRTLNKDAADVLRPFEPSAVTDVTGFGLFGHAHEIASAATCGIVLESERLPAIDGALDLARKGVRTSGDPRNRDFAAPHVSAAGSPAFDALGYDPQTAGGFLVSLPKDEAPRSRRRSRRGACSCGASAASRKGPGSPLT